MAFGRFHSPDCRPCDELGNFINILGDVVWVNLFQFSCAVLSRMDWPTCSKMKRIFLYIYLTILLWQSLWRFMYLVKILIATKLTETSVFILKHSRICSLHFRSFEWSVKTCVILGYYKLTSLIMCMPNSFFSVKCASLGFNILFSNLNLTDLLWHLNMCHWFGN